MDDTDIYREDRSEMYRKVASTQACRIVCDNCGKKWLENLDVDERRGMRADDTIHIHYCAHCESRG